MERGPVALFGAIVALGLGPAMWLGAQFGGVPVRPVQPPVITVDQVRAPGGAGAGEEPEDTTEAVDTKVGGRQRPAVVVTTIRRPAVPSTRVRPTATVAPTTASPTAAPTVTTTMSSPPAADAPTESTDEPVEPSPAPTWEHPAPLHAGVALG